MAGTCFLCHLPPRWGKRGAPPALKPSSSDRPEKVTLIPAPEGVYFLHRDPGTGGSAGFLSGDAQLLSLPLAPGLGPDRSLQTQVPQSPAGSTRAAASVVPLWAPCPDETEVPAFPLTVQVHPHGAWRREHAPRLATFQNLLPAMYTSRDMQCSLTITRRGLDVLMGPSTLGHLSNRFLQRVRGNLRPWKHLPFIPP